MGQWDITVTIYFDKQMTGGQKPCNSFICANQKIGKEIHLMNPPHEPDQ